MNYWKEQLEQEGEQCPEGERFLDSEDSEKGYGYYPTKSKCLENYFTGECDGSCNQSFLEESTLYFFGSIAEEIGFKTFERNVEGVTSLSKQIINGFFVDENNHSGFIHWKTDRDLVPGNFKEKIGQLVKVDNFFVGEKFSLFKVGDNRYALDSKLLRNIQEAITLFKRKLPYFITYEYRALPDGTLFGILMDDNSLFIIAPLIGFDEWVEEEKITLIERLDSAHPFFQIKPYRKVDWSKLREPKGSHFESLCEILLSKEKNIVDLQSVGKTNAADRGRDFILIQNSRDLNGKLIPQKYLVQCKYSEDTINPKTVPDWVNRVIEHQVDGYWLITNNDVSPALFDQLNDAKKNTKIKIDTKLWQRIRFDILFNMEPDFFTEANFDFS